MIRFRLLSTLCVAHYFLEGFLRPVIWNLGVLGFFTVALTLPNPPLHSPSFYLITHQPAYPNLPPEPTHPNTLPSINLCTSSFPAMQRLALQPVCLFQDFWVWGMCWVMVMCLRGGTFIKECIRDYINRQILWEGWFLWFPGWAKGLPLTPFFFASQYSIYLVMFQWKGNAEERESLPTFHITPNPHILPILSTHVYYFYIFPPNQLT